MKIRSWSLCKVPTMKPEFCSQSRPSPRLLILRGALVHCDAAQMPGKVSVCFDGLGCRLCFLSVRTRCMARRVSAPATCVAGMPEPRLRHFSEVEAKKGN
jgi:hypothetical protein